MTDEPTLNEVLKRLGYTTKPAASMYAKYIIRDGKTIFVGTADEVWRWLRETGRLS